MLIQERSPCASGDRNFAGAVSWIAAAAAGKPPSADSRAGDALAGLLRDGARALGDLGGGGLRRGHNEELGIRDELGHGDGHVAGSRGQVHEEDVEFGPVDVGKKLLDSAREHRAAPHDGRVSFDELPPDERPKSGTASFSSSWDSEDYGESFLADLVERWRIRR